MIGTTSAESFSKTIEQRRPMPRQPTDTAVRALLQSFARIQRGAQAIGVARQFLVAAQLGAGGARAQTVKLVIHFARGTGRGAEKRGIECSQFLLDARN